jgi:hypothetical protein
MLNLHIGGRRNVFEKLVGTCQLVKKFLAFYGTRKFITVYILPLPSGPYAEQDKFGPLRHTVVFFFLNFISVYPH